MVKPLFAAAIVYLSLLFSPSDGFLVSVAEDQEIEIIANPYDQRESSSPCQQQHGGAPLLLDRLLEPHQLIVNPMVTQADSFQEIKYAKVLTVPVPVYRMKQPARISSDQHEFQMVLVKELGVKGANSIIEEVPYPMEQAMDSWFPGYYWAPLVMACNSSESDGEDNYHYQHVGWKFT